MIKLFEQFNNEQEIHDICQEYNIENYIINDDGSIDVDGDVYLRSRNLSKLPLKFNKVRGRFSCSSNKLTSLEGCPKYVDDGFYCSFNKLTSLEGCPEYVDGVFYCHSNRLTTLEGCPKVINDNFNCSNNNLTSLKGIPEYINGEFNFRDNPINKIDTESEINDIIYLPNIDNHIKYLHNYYLRMLFRYGLDYKIFNDDGSINDKQLQHFINDFKENES